MRPKSKVTTKRPANGRKGKHRFEAIDQHVRNTPPEATQSLESLAEYLNSAATNDLERVRAMYRWITENIAYDIDGRMGKRPSMPVDAESVLKNRMCVCDGYARLMMALCKLVSVECMRLVGYSKDITYDAVTPIADIEPDHSWNAVKLDGQWRLIDATWGAGSVTADGDFVKAQTDFYFLTDPKIFVESHFPFMFGDTEENQKWQLLDDPIDLDTFHSRVGRSESCFDQGVQLVSHNQALIETTDELTLKFRGTGKRLTGFSAYFVDRDTGERPMDCRHVAVLLDPQTNEATVIARPPTSCVYWELRVFGTTAKHSGASYTSNILVSYRIRASAGEKVSRFPFPKNSSHYGVAWNPKRFGFANVLGPFWIKAEGGEHELRVPIASSMSNIADFLLAMPSDENDKDKFTFVEFDEGFLRICVRMHQPGYHMLRLYGKDLLENCPNGTFLLVANFLIECTHPMARPRPFPKASGFVLTERVTLESPRDWELPANSKVEFRLNSPTLGVVFANELLHRKTATGFRFWLSTGAAGRDISVFGAVDPNAVKYQHIFTFRVVAAS